MARRRSEGKWAKLGRGAMLEIADRPRRWVPERTADHLEEEGRVIVLAPRFRNRLGRALVDVLGRDQTFRVNLDEFGSAAWALIDGERDVGAIVDALTERFGEKIEPALPRFLAFLKSLHNLGVAKVRPDETGTVSY